MIDLKKELILIGLVAVNSYLINSSEAATNDSEVNIAINEFNSQDYTENILDNEIQGYNFMAENALNGNDALKQELLIQIDEATKIGDIALAKTLRDYYNNLTKLGKAPITIKILNKAIKSCLKYAKKMNYIIENCCDFTKLSL
mgnify:CR=1 FL=1